MTGITTIYKSERRHTYRGIDFRITKHIEIWKGWILNNNYRVNFPYINLFTNKQRIYKKTTGKYGDYIFNNIYLGTRKSCKQHAKREIDIFLDTDYLSLIYEQEKKLNSMKRNYIKIKEIVDSYKKDD